MVHNRDLERGPETGRRLLADRLERACAQLTVTHLVWSRNAAGPVPELGHPSLQPVPRLLVGCSGSKRVRHAAAATAGETSVRAGHAMYLQAGRWFSIDPRPAHRSLGIVFLPDFVRVLWVACTGAGAAPAVGPWYHTGRPLGQTGQLLLRAVEHLAREGDETGGVPVIQGLLHEVVKELRRAPTQTAGKALQTWRMVAEYVRENFRHDVDRRTVADACALNPDYVSQLFVRFAGTTFSRYLAGIRVRLALDLLEATDLPIAQIAEECGFAGANYFIKVFKRRCGTTPAGHRRRVRASP